MVELIKSGKYIEIQIHGEIDLMNDIGKITISRSEYISQKEVIDNLINKFQMIQFIIY